MAVKLRFVGLSWVTMGCGKAVVSSCVVVSFGSACSVVFW